MRVFLLLASILVGCAPQNAHNGPHPEHGADSAAVRGTVAVVGSAPVNLSTVVRGADGDVRIDGSLAMEIGRLSGAEVEVFGERRTDAMYGSAVAATSYRIVSVGGAPAVMGVVERGTDGALQLRTEEGEVVRLSGPTGGLRIGQKVWVQGPSSMEVRSYGVVRP
jgi:hypothetical protein